MFSLEHEQIRDLDDERAFGQTAICDVTPVVADHPQIAQGMVRHTEPEIHTHLSSVGIVLEKRVEERPRADAVQTAVASPGRA